MQMEKRKLGSAGPEVPAICLGGNVYGWTLNEADTFRQLDAALAAGLNFVDTADVYSRWAPGNKGGESETLIGKWFAQTGKRKDVILATKVGMDMGAGKKGLKAAYIQQAVESSLERLQTHYIDLYRRLRVRLSACRPITSTSTGRTRTIPKPRWKRRWAHSTRW
jgi:aryl-alcohol dehydrogenase-like predicted oxidoreductase